jgi:hypothetical protein
MYDITLSGGEGQGERAPSRRYGANSEDSLAGYDRA